MNLCYFAAGFSQVIPLSAIEAGTLLQDLVICYKLSELEYRCRGTGKNADNGRELFEGHIIKDPGGAIGVVVWNSSHSQFLVLFDGETAEVDDTTSEWATILGHILTPGEEKLVSEEQYDSCLFEIFKFKGVSE